MMYIFVLGALVCFVCFGALCVVCAVLCAACCLCIAACLLACLPSCFLFHASLPDSLCYTLARTYIYICTHNMYNICNDIPLSLSIYIYVCIYCIHVCIHMTYAHIIVDVCLCIYIYIYMYIYIYILCVDTQIYVIHTSDGRARPRRERCERAGHDRAVHEPRRRRDYVVPGHAYKVPTFKTHST